MKTLILYLFNIMKTPYFFFSRNKISTTTRVVLPTTILRSSVGKYGYIGSYSTIKFVKMGNYCSLAAGVNIGGMEHPYRYGSTSPRLFPKKMLVERPTTIEDDVWIGANAIVRQGVRVGRGAVIGAGAVVVKDVPPYSIVVGVPAAVIKYRFGQKTIDALQRSNFWTHPPIAAKRILDNVIYD